MDRLALNLTDMLFKDFAVPFQRYQGTTEFAFAPDFEVKETKEAIVLKADLPGVKLDDVDVQVHGKQLTVTGKRDREELADGERFHMLERAYGTFTRGFTLPNTVNTQGLEAELKDGVLTLTLPKVPEAQPQKVTVRGAK